MDGLITRGSSGEGEEEEVGQEDQAESEEELLCTCFTFVCFVLIFSDICICDTYIYDIYM